MDVTAPQDQPLPGLTRIELLNPDGTYYFRADIEPRQARQLQAEKKRRGVTFQEVVHEAFMLGPVTDANRLPLILGPREFFSICEGQRRLQQVPITPSGAIQPTTVGECPFCGHSLFLTLGPVPASPQHHSVHFRKDQASAHRQPQQFFTPGEAAQLLRVSRYTIWAYCRRGVIRAVKVGRGYKIKSTELDRILDEGTLPTKAPKPQRR